MMRRSRKGGREGERWVWLTNTADPENDVWDAAFAEVIRRSYLLEASPSSDDDSTPGRFFFVNCNTTGHFLCGVWQTRAPALVHFQIEDAWAVDMAPDSSLTYSSSLQDLRPVTARIIEFPLPATAYLPLPPGVFPSPEEQVTRIVYGEGVVEQFARYSATAQLLQRWEENPRVVAQRPGTLAWYLAGLDASIDRYELAPYGLWYVKAGAELISFALGVLSLKAVLFGYDSFRFVGQVAAVVWEVFTSDDDDDDDDDAPPQQGRSSREQEGDLNLAAGEWFEAQMARMLAVADIPPSDAIPSTTAERSADDRRAAATILPQQIQDALAVATDSLLALDPKGLRSAAAAGPPPQVREIFERIMQAQMGVMFEEAAAEHVRVESSVRDD